jgi:hypothetical protein
VAFFSVGSAALIYFKNDIQKNRGGVVAEAVRVGVGAFRVRALDFDARASSGGVITDKAALIVLPRACLKGQCTRFSTSGFFFHQTTRSGPLIHRLKHFRIWLRIREVIRQSRCLSGVNDTAEVA